MDKIVKPVTDEEIIKAHFPDVLDSTYPLMIKHLTKDVRQAANHFKREGFREALQEVIARMHNINSTSPDCKDADTRYTQLLAELREMREELQVKEGGKEN